MIQAIETVVDLEFPLRGDMVPADHGYSLYAALCRVLPWAHADEAVGIHPIRGRLVGGRALALTLASRLRLRLPASRIAEALPLAGQQLDLGGARLGVGVPTIRPLSPAPTLASRLAVIKGFQEPEPFLEAAQRQAEALGIEGRLALLARANEGSLEGATSRAAGDPIRRTLRIHDREIVGFALAATELTAEESLRVQEVGIGGRRRFGCGLFVPLRGGRQ
jgi:CRISPR-associated endonuclease/helicase Cas3